MKKLLFSCIFTVFTGNLFSQISALSGCIAGAAPGCPVPYPYPPTSGSAILGRDNGFNLFVGGNLVIKSGGAELEGRTFVRGDFDLQKTSGTYNVGVVGAGSFVVPDDNTDMFIVGGNLISAGATTIFGGFVGATPVPGNLRYKGSITGTYTSGSPTGLLISDPALDLTPYQTKLTEGANKSTSDAGLASSPNQPFNNAFGTFTFNSTNGAPGTYVFNIATDLDAGFSGTAAFTNFPDNAEIVINMQKSGIVNINIGDYSFSMSGGGNPDKLMERVLWNFPNATTVNFTGGGQFRGSILSRANDNFIDASTNGRIFATGNVIQGTTSSGLEFHNYPFRATGLITLPVKLESFTGNIIANKARLTWKTQNEYDILYHKVEMSTNGTDFKNVGTVASLNTSESTYTFDYQLGIENNYYFRLKMVDRNGSYTYSNVVRLKTAKDNDFSVNITPNPARDNLTINLFYAEKADVKFFDSFGRVVKQFSIVDNTNSVSLKTLPRGIYFVRVTNKEGDYIVRKVIVE